MQRGEEPNSSGDKQDTHLKVFSQISKNKELIHHKFLFHSVLLELKSMGIR